MSKFAPKCHSALDAESHKLVALADKKRHPELDSGSISFVDSKGIDRFRVEHGMTKCLHSSPEGVNKGLEYQFQPLRLLKKGEARWGATRRANSPVETVIVPRHPQTQSGDPAFENLLYLTTSWIPVLRTIMTIRALGGAL